MGAAFSCQKDACSLRAPAGTAVRGQLTSRVPTTAAAGGRADKASFPSRPSFESTGDVQPSTAEPALEAHAGLKCEPAAAACSPGTATASPTTQHPPGVGRKPAERLLSDLGLAREMHDGREGCTAKRCRRQRACWLLQQLALLAPALAARAVNLEAGQEPDAVCCVCIADLLRL